MDGRACRHGGIFHYTSVDRFRLHTHLSDTTTLASAEVYAKITAPLGGLVSSRWLGRATHLRNTEPASASMDEVVFHTRRYSRSCRSWHDAGCNRGCSLHTSPGNLLCLSRRLLRPRVPSVPPCTSLRTHARADVFLGYGKEQCRGGLLSPLISAT